MSKSLDFPVEAKKAAISQIQKWGHKLNQSIDELIIKLECDLSNEFQDGLINYGIEDSILSGTRLRLFHQFGSGKPRMNCGELGVNLFLFYSALGIDESVRLMRFNDGQQSDHFALLHFDRGFDSNPVILDPLFKHFGRAKIISDGFIYYPWNWLQDGKDDLQHSLQNPKLYLPRRIKTQCSLLTKDQIIRHVNYINSPLGFLDFFANGQKIRIIDRDRIQLIEFTAKSIDEKLVVSATGYDSSLDFFTFERTYNVSNGKLKFSDRYLLHTRYEWIEPNQVLYTEKNRKGKVYPLRNGGKTEMALIWYVRALMVKNGRLFGQEERDGLIRELKNDLSEYEQRLANQESSSRVNLNDILSLEAEKANTARLYLGYLDSLDENARKNFMDHIIFINWFKRRWVGFVKPYTSFWPEEKPVPVLGKYTNYRYGLFKEKIKEFFASDTMDNLLRQYGESLWVKNHVGV